ncbi:hypothetical protein ACMGDM_17060 [Sphingomonas sp. DT-51]|uniref:hypothetical protein n=1 Tax=Sphingomonas sp. DT-51 TaxID=3396165 RepID=UPI003F1B1CB9
MSRGHLLADPVAYDNMEDGKNMKRLTITVLLVLAGCTKQQDARSDREADARPAPAAAMTKVKAHDPDVRGKPEDASAYVGRWKGVEGMYLLVSRRSDGVELEMQWDLDNRGTYRGIVTPEGIDFERGGKTLRLVHESGAATELTGLAGKKDCLVVKAGEGYCRD